MAVQVEAVMLELEAEVRRLRRKRLLARGGAPAYEDPEVYARVDALLRTAIEARQAEALLLPDLLTGETDWQLQLHLQYASHRPVLGRVLLAIKRRLLLPVLRWLYEYSLENFRRQRRVNDVLFACVEELAIQHVVLSRRVDAATSQPQSPEPGAPRG